MTRRPPTIAAAALAAMLLPAVALTGCGGDPTTSSGVEGQTTTTVVPRFGAPLGRQTATFQYTIPAGANAALAQGNPMTILPGSIDATVGQTIKIVNNDMFGHTVGPWYVGPNESLFQEFTAPGTYEGSCTVNPSGAFVLNVDAS